MINIQKLIKATLLILVLCFSLATTVQHAGGYVASAATIEDDCDGEDWCGEEDEDEDFEDEEDDLVEDDDDSEDSADSTQPVAPSSTATNSSSQVVEQQCTNMKECNVPETGPGEVLVSVLGVSVLGYGLRKWFASRHAKRQVIEGLYRREQKV